jgi:hypothetical protein
MATRRNNIILYKRIQSKYKELHMVQKLRYDYVLELLRNEFCKSEGTLQHILRMNLPDELPVVDPQQLEIFSERHSTAN